MPGLDLLDDWTIDCYRTAVVSTALETLGDGNIGVPDDGVAEGLEVTAADPLDDFANAAGWARQVRTTYVSTTDGTLKTVTTNLSGTTPVSLGVADAGPVVRFDAVAHGTGGKTAKGNISLRRTTGAVGRAAIRAGNNSAAIGQFKVPTGFKARVTAVDFLMANSNALEILVLADYDPLTGARTAGVLHTVPGLGFHNKQQFWIGGGLIPQRWFPAGTLIVVKAKTVSATSEIAGAVHLKLARDLSLASDPDNP